MGARGHAQDCAGISANVTRQLAKNDASVHTLDLSRVKLQSIFSTQKSKEATYASTTSLVLSLGGTQFRYRAGGSSCAI
jgi:hypothetical protein